MQTNSFRFQFDLEQIIWRFMAITLVKLFFRFIKNHRYRPGNLVMLLKPAYHSSKGRARGSYFKRHKLSRQISLHITASRKKKFKRIAYFASHRLLQFLHNWVKKIMKSQNWQITKYYTYHFILQTYLKS